MALHLSEPEKQKIGTRLNLWIIVVAGVIGLLIVRFWVLQFVQYDVWHFIAEENQIRKETIPAMRGNIYDRNKLPLADWRQSFNITVTPADLTQDSVMRLAEILETEPDELRARIREKEMWSIFIPVSVAEDVEWEKFARVEEDRLLMPGVGTEIRPVRKYYLDSGLVSHVIGYLGEVDKKELEKLKDRGYRMGDLIGRAGIEKVLESSLRGTEGVDYKLVDARGREISMDALRRESRKPGYQGKLGVLDSMSRPVRPGYSAVLSLDLRFQKIAARHMEGRRGSVVAMDVNTGDVLVMLSMPLYDPSLFAKMTEQQWEKLRNSEGHPLLNRAIQGCYPPGSIFKIVMAAAALEEGHVDPETECVCDGSFHLLDSSFGCWRKEGHGKVDMKKAIVESCDVYFYKLGDQIGIETISKWAGKFGLGKRTGIELPDEKTGLVPDPKWKKEKTGLPWFPGETILTSIGQGYLHITPLQAVLIPASVAGGNTLMKPRLILRIEDVNGNVIKRFPPKPMSSGMLSERTRLLLREAMLGVVEDERGTARWSVMNDTVRIAGKTGTAEVSRKYKGEDIEDIPYEHRDHSWFVAYAPAEAPRVAIAVLVEHGGSGAATAGAIAREILADYFRLIQAKSPEETGSVPG